MYSRLHALLSIHVHWRIWSWHPYFFLSTCWMTCAMQAVMSCYRLSAYNHHNRWRHRTYVLQFVCQCSSHAPFCCCAVSAVWLRFFEAWTVAYPLKTCGVIKVQVGWLNELRVRAWTMCAVILYTTWHSFENKNLKTATIPRLAGNTSAAEIAPT